MSPSPAQTQRRLVLLRHAKTEQTSPDHERALTARGRGDSVAAGHWLLTAGLVPDLVLSSTATRARQTWELAASAGERLQGVEVWPERAAYQAAPADLLRVLRGAPEDRGTVLLVGHNPAIADLAAELADPEGPPEPLEQLRNGLPTCTLAVLEPAGADWSDLAPGSARLVGLHRARG